MKTSDKKLFQRVSTILMLTAILLGQFAPVIEAQAAAALTVTPITWNVIGLDSNKVTVGPNLFPIGAHVCNSGNANATDVTSAFVFDDGLNLFTGGTYINLRSSSLSAHTTSGTTLTPGSCTDFYYEVEVKRDANAYDTTRKYHITASANSGAVTGSTPTPRELYVEHLVSQSRNAVTDVQLEGTSIPAGGTMSLMVGNTYTIKLIGFTATQGYNQLESFINFPNTIFQVLAVSSTFTAGTSPITTLYADACGWDNVTTSPTYRSCIVSDNKSGGDVTVTYTVKILSAGTGGAATLGTLLYDFSGSSYHYNSDFGISSRYAEIIDPSSKVSISKAFLPSSIPAGGSSTLTVTLTNTAAVTITGANFSDSLPASPGQMVVATPSVYSTSGCGSPTFAPVAGASSFSVSGVTLAPNGSCVLNIAVSVPATPTSGTYANTITNFKIGSSPTAGLSSNTANLTVSAASGSTGTGLCGVDIATWNFTGAASGALTSPYTANSPSGSTAAMTWGNGLSMEGDTTSGGGNPQPGGLSYGWQKNSPIVTATSAYIQFAVNTNQYSGVKLRFDVQRKANGPNNDELYYSTNGTTWTSKSTFTSTTSWASYPSASTYYDFTGLTNASGITYFRIYGYGANATSSGNDLTVDNVSFSGCGPAAAPTITKVFNTNPVAVNGTSTLTFTLYNPNSSNTLNDVRFTDVLPSGLSFAADSSSTVCGGTLAITASSGTISFSGGVLTGGATCYVTTPAITVSTSGPHPNISGFISSTESGTNATANGSAKRSIVGLLPPTIEKLFSANPILSGGTSTLTFTITNPNPGDALPSVAFADTFPTSPGAMIVASPVTKSTSGCGTPTFAPNAGDASISFSNGTIAAGGTCTVSILVKVPATTGSYANTSGAVTSTVDSLTIGSDTASSTLVVNAPNPGFTFNKQVGASSSGPWSSFVTVAPGATVYYKFTLENIGDVPLTLTAPVITDAKVSTAGCVWPATLPVASSSADPTAICTVSVTAVAGDHPNVASATAYYGSTPYTATADATYYGVASGALNLSKQVSTSASGPWTTDLTGVTPGSNLYYRFSVINKTGVSLTSLNLTDPQILTATLDACEASFTSPLENNGSTFCVLGPVTAAASGSVTNTATVSGVNGVTPYTSASASASYTLAAPLLNLAKTNNNTTLTVNGSTTYVLTVSNAGNTATSGTISVIDVLPSGLTVSNGAVTLGGVNSANWSCTAASNVLTCASSTSIAASGTSEFSFTAAVGAGATGTLTNKAQVGGGGTGITPTSTSAGACTATNAPTQGCAVDSDTATTNAVPLAVNDSATATAGIAKNIDVLHNDTQLGDTPTGIKSSTISTPAKGTAVYNNNGTTGDPTDDYIVYTPIVSASGTDTFTYEICDSTTPTADCSTATVTVTINPVPVAVNDSATATAGVAKNISVLTNDTQLGDTPTTIQSGTISTPAKGTAVYNNNGTGSDSTDDYIVYTPYVTASGTDTFTYQICDSTTPTADCSTATVTVTLNAVPVAVDDSTTATAGVQKTISVMSNDTQLADTPTTLTSIPSAPSKGSATISGSNILYTPNANASGTDTFTYRICDSTTPTADCSTATVTVTINAVPVAVNDSDTATAGVAQNITVLANDTQLGDAPTGITAISSPTQGTAVLNSNGTPSNPADDYIVYTPNANASGTDTFTYTICDSTSTPDCSTATVTVQVSAGTLAMIGLAKELIGSPVKIAAGLFELTYKFWVRNYGALALNSIQVTDNLATIFSSPTTYTVQSLTSTDFTVNTSFNGDSDQNLLSATGNTLPVSNSYKTITLVIRVIPASATSFSNTATASGKDSNSNTVTDVSQDGSDPDQSGGSSITNGDGDPTNNSGGTSVTFSASIFDPPFGIKTYDDTGLPVLRWTMIWINETNIPALGARVADPISEGTAYAGGLVCTPASLLTTTTTCAFEPASIAFPRGRIIWEGTLGPDQGHLDAAVANNELDISFNVSVLTGTSEVNNTASIDADLNGDHVYDLGTEASLANSHSVWTSAGSSSGGSKKQKLSDATLLPMTGFAPSLFSRIPAQPDGAAYQTYSGLTLEIPELDVKTEIIGVPFLQGNWDTTWLGDRAGYLAGTAFPTWDGNSVITGHVYGFNGQPGLFVNLGSLHWGSRVIIHAYGQKFTYEVRSVRTIKPDNVSVLGHQDNSWVTLLTCKQYDAATGLYRLRTAVQAVLIRTEPDTGP